VPSLDPEEWPATLSPAIITGELRNKLGFQGLVFTDAMDMGGVTQFGRFGELSVRALEAGCDVILFAHRPEEGIAAVAAAVRSARLSEKRVDASVRRVLAVKQRLGLDSPAHAHRDPNAADARAQALLGGEQGLITARRIAERCLVLLVRHGAVPPLKRGSTVATADVGGPPVPTIMSKGVRTFPAALTRAGFKVVKLTSPDSLASSDALVIALYPMGMDAMAGNKLRSSVRTAVAQKIPTVVAVFGNPYAASLIPSGVSVILAFDDSVAVQEAAARALNGSLPFKGIPPVTVTVGGIRPPGGRVNPTIR
jgi:beta-N-acetylhexosaminidase